MVALEPVGCDFHHSDAVMEELCLLGQEKEIIEEYAPRTPTIAGTTVRFLQQEKPPALVVALKPVGCDFHLSDAVTEAFQPPISRPVGLIPVSASLHQCVVNDLHLCLSERSESSVVP